MITAKELVEGEEHMLKATKEGLFEGDKMIASAVELRHAGFEPAQLGDQPDMMARAKEVMDRRHALPAGKLVNFEEDGDVLWA